MKILVIGAGLLASQVAIAQLCQDKDIELHSVDTAQEAKGCSLCSKDSPLFDPAIMVGRDVVMVQTKGGALLTPLTRSPWKPVLDVQRRVEDVDAIPVPYGAITAVFWELYGMSRVYGERVNARSLIL